MVLKKDDQIPDVGREGVSIKSLSLDAKQTEPPARYSQEQKLIQEMEKRGLGTKSTRASIIVVYLRKYLKMIHVEPSQLGMAIIDALSQFAPHITSPDMTAEPGVRYDKRC